MDAFRRLLHGDDEGHEALRATGALLLGAGLLMLFFRYSGSFGEPWGDFPLFLILLVPAVALYGLGIAAHQATGPRPWQAVLVVFGLIFVPLTLYQFLELVGGDTASPLNTFWIWAVVAGLAFLGGLLAGVRFALLFGGIAVLISLLGLADEVLADGLFGDFGTFRGICVLIAALLVGGALVLFRRDPVFGGRRAGELLTAAGFALVLGAGVVSTLGLSSSFVPTPDLSGSDSPAEASVLWDTVLLVGSLALIVAGTRFDARGPGYVGAFGLLLFILIAGFDLDDVTPEPSVLGWPLLLLAAGAVATAVSLVPGIPLGPRRREEAPGQATTAGHEPASGGATAVHEPPPGQAPPPPHEPPPGRGTAPHEPPPEREPPPGPPPASPPPR